MSLNDEYIAPQLQLFITLFHNINHTQESLVMMPIMYLQKLCDGFFSFCSCFHILKRFYNVENDIILSLEQLRE